MRINVMRKGEEFIGLVDNKILLRNKKGEVRIVRLIEDEDGIRIDPEEITISYGDGTVEYGDIENDIEITNF